MMKFDFPNPDNSGSIIKVIGVGGGGSNAVNHMFRQGIRGVDFIVCNTDQQALDMSPVQRKIQLGTSLTEGRGAGSIPDVGRNAAIENIEELRTILGENTKMVFITAGMGGGTGTGAAPVIAGIAKEMGILTVAIITVPFSFEGKKRKMQAESGLEELKKNVDTLLVICNDKVREMYGNLRLGEAFAQADNILTTAAKSIAEIITVTGYVNVDFADIKTVMTNSGVAIMGSAAASGEDRALKAVELALASPLLNDSHIKGAANILLYINSGDQEVTMDEVSEITDYIQAEAGQTADIIWGNGVDATLGDQITVTVIATGFQNTYISGAMPVKKPEKVMLTLDEKKPEPVVQVEKFPIENIEEKPEEPFIITRREEQQVSIEFDMRKPVKEPVQELEQEKPVFEENFVLKTVQKNEQEDEQIKKQQERLNQLKHFNYKLNTATGLNDLENEPAYKRRNVQLGNVPHSSESNISKYTLSEDEDKQATLKPNNPFLHDNVD